MFLNALEKKRCATTRYATNLDLPHISYERQRDSKHLLSPDMIFRGSLSVAGRSEER